MELDGALFSVTLRWWAGGLYALALFLALRLAPWGRLRGERLHVFLGACVCLILLWSLRIQAMEGVYFHFLGVTSVTLIFGWSLAVIASSLALVGVTLNGGAGWNDFVLNALLAGVLPISFTLAVLVLVRSLLPRNFFIYVLVNGFLAGALSALAAAYAAVGLLLASGAHGLPALSEVLLPFFPLMFLPEGFINGWLMTVLVAFRPHWVYSFADEDYINGK